METFRNPKGSALACRCFVLTIMAFGYEKLMPNSGLTCKSTWILIYLGVISLSSWQTIKDKIVSLVTWNLLVRQNVRPLGHVAKRSVNVKQLQIFNCSIQTYYGYGESENKEKLPNVAQCCQNIFSINMFLITKQLMGFFVQTHERNSGCSLWNAVMLQ